MSAVDLTSESSTPTRDVDALAIVDVQAGDDLSPLAGTWEVDPTHSALEFVARYAVFTLVRGRFTSFSGTVEIDPLHREATRVDVNIDASSVDTAMAARDAHLRGQEFFDVEHHPQISSTPVTPACWQPVVTRCTGS
jgi:polyisoprenoid-binding protein YceI